jgi:glycosyltransferase involved in cell wall biosynthesis
MNRLAYIDQMLIEHRHHVTGKSNVDATYKRNDALWDEDKAVYEKRKQGDFSLFSPPFLSVLICSMPERSAMLDKLVDELEHQTKKYSGAGSSLVEVIFDMQPSASIGEKRQRLLEHARGNYVCFVDDDDWVAHDYIESIVDALSSSAPDTVAISGVMTTAGAAPEPFHNSMKYKEWHSKDGVHFRTPTHLSPVKRELALQAGFPRTSYGEDHDYSRRLLPLLKTEVSAGEKPLYYYFYWPRSEKKEEK